MNLGSFRILLPFFWTSWGVGVLNSAIFNSFHNRVEFGMILEGIRNFRGGGGVWNPLPPSVHHWTYVRNCCNLWSPSFSLIQGILYPVHYGDSTLPQQTWHTFKKYNSPHPLRRNPFKKNINCSLQFYIVVMLQFLRNLKARTCGCCLWYNIHTELIETVYLILWMARQRKFGDKIKILGREL